MSFANFLPRQKKNSKGGAAAASLADRDQNGKKQSLGKFKSSKHLRKHSKEQSAELARAKLERRFSRSETALTRILPNQSTGDEGPMASTLETNGLARHKTALADQGAQQGRDRASDDVSPLSTFILDDAGARLSAAALEMPELGPIFGIEAVLDRSSLDVLEQHPQKLTSTSSTPDTWERQSSYYSPASSTSSLSNYSTGNTPVRGDSPSLPLHGTPTGKSGKGVVSSKQSPPKPPSNRPPSPPNNSGRKPRLPPQPQPHGPESTSAQQQSNRRRANSSADLKNKPLPQVPTIAIPKEMPPRAPNHIAQLMSKYSQSAPTRAAPGLDESPVDRYGPRLWEANNNKNNNSNSNISINNNNNNNNNSSSSRSKTQSLVSFDLETELDRIIGESRKAQTTPSPRPQSIDEDGEGEERQTEEVDDVQVAPLKLSGRKSTSADDQQQQQQQEPPPTTQKERTGRARAATAGSFSLFPPPVASSPPSNIPPALKISAVQPPSLTHSLTQSHPQRSEPRSSGESDASASMEPSAQRSVSTKTVGRKLRYSLRLGPNLRRQKTAINGCKRAEPANAGSALVTLEDDQAALAKSTDRYIDAEIAKALAVAYEEQEGPGDGDLNDQDHYHSSNDNYNNNNSNKRTDNEADEWSTIYPLKAVKKLGIPLMSSSHIPRLSSPDNERALRLQLPKLNTTAPNALAQPQIIPQPPPSKPASVKSYPETPDDVGLHSRSFIMDSPSVQSPIDEEDEGQEQEQEERPPHDNVMPHSDKIFVALNKMKTVSEEEMSPKTQEVPLIFNRSSAPGSGQPPMLYELDGNGSTPIAPTPNPFANANLPMPSRMPDKVVMALMTNACTLEQLFNYALLNRQFYRVFKKNELSLIKNALFQMSPPAWELREMSPPWAEELQSIQDPDATVPEYTPTSYLRHYGRDMINLAKLKSLILARCGTVVRPDTVGGLAGTDEIRAGEIDEAFWRIWTFCRIFGCAKNREADVNGQMDWLNGGVVANGNRAGATVFMPEPSYSMNNVLFDPPAGFGLGNGTGLTHGQLYDMMEIWNCLGVLVHGVRGETKEARLAGVFDGIDLTPGDITKEDAMLEEWIAYVLTLGPSALVALSTVCPTDSARATFVKAKQMRVTQWEPPEPGSSRQAFLREAIARTYETRIAPQQATATQQQQRTSNGGSPTRRNNSTPTSEPRVSYSTSVAAREPGRRPDLAIKDGDDAPPHFYNNTNNTSPPYMAPGRDMTAVAHAPPPQYSTHSTFIDPVDKAIAMMVNELGFSEHDAKWALKITDTGDMLDTEAAVRLLLKERKKRSKGKVSQLWRSGSGNNTNSGDESGPENLVDPLVNAPKHSSGAGWRWA